MPDRRIPLPQAEAELAERIQLGQRLLDGVRQGSHWIRAQQKRAWDEAVRWHDDNCTWLEGNLGGDVRAEYQAVTGRTYDYSNPPSKRDISEREPATGDRQAGMDPRAAAALARSGRGGHPGRP
jgi:hypothetical protein